MGLESCLGVTGLRSASTLRGSNGNLGLRSTISRDTAMGRPICGAITTEEVQSAPNLWISQEQRGPMMDKGFNNPYGVKNQKSSRARFKFSYVLCLRGPWATDDDSVILKGYLGSQARI